MADKKDKKDKTPAATFGSIALQNYTAQRGYEIGQDTSLGETLKPAVNLLGEYAKNAEIERGKFLSSLPDDFKVELLPASGKEAFTNFASDAKQKYSEAAGLAAKYSANPNSEQYRNAVKDMESIKGGLSNSFDSYTKLADLRQGYINNEKANNKPIAMDVKDTQIYDAITKGDYKNFENTTDGLVYNYTDPITKDVEKIPFNELPNTKFVDSEMSTNVIASVLKNPYASGVNGDDMETSLSTANNEVQKLINTPEGYRQAVFNGFDGPKTKFIDYYVGEQFITNNDQDFLNGIEDINADGEITKDDMQNGVWSFKEGDVGEKAREVFENKITEHQNDKNFDVKTQLSEFMNGIAKDKYLEGQANKFKKETYNLKGFGPKKHSQVQGEFNRLNNNEAVSDSDGVKYNPAPGKPGFYTIDIVDEKGKVTGQSPLIPRNLIEQQLDIFDIRDDFNTDPVKAAATNTTTNTTTTTTIAGETTNDGETTIVNTEEPVAEVEVDGVTGAAIKVDPPKESEFVGDVDYTNQTKEAPIPRSAEIKELKATLKDIKKQANSNGLTTLRDPKLREDIAEQIKLSDSYIKAIDDAYMNTGIINEEGVMRRGIPFISNTSFGGRGDLHKNYNSEKKRNKRLREKYNNLPEPVGDKEPVKNDEVKSDENMQELPTKTVKKVETNLEPSIRTIEAGEVELKDTEGNVVVGSKEAVKSKASYNKTLGDSLISNEGFRENMYYDMATDEDPTAGTPTIGYGYTKEALNGKDGVPSWTEYWNADGTPTGKKMTEEVADSIKETIVNRYVKQVNSDIKVDLTESQNNALVDLYYRNGAGNIAKSGILELINAGKIEEAAELIKAGGKNGRLIKAGSKVLKEGDELFEGIVNRNNRAAENLLVGLETQDQTQA